MLEKEIKVLNLGTAEEIENILLNKGCKLVKYEEQENYVYHFKHKCIRLRVIESFMDGSITYEHTTKTNVETTEKHKIENERTINITEKVFKTLFLNYHKLPDYNCVLAGKKLVEGVLII